MTAISLTVPQADAPQVAAPPPENSSSWLGTAAKVTGIVLLLIIFSPILIPLAVVVLPIVALFWLGLCQRVSDGFSSPIVVNSPSYRPIVKVPYHVGYAPPIQQRPIVVVPTGGGGHPQVGGGNVRVGGGHSW